MNYFDVDSLYRIQCNNFSEMRCPSYLFVRRTGEKVLEEELIFGDPVTDFL